MKSILIILCTLFAVSARCQTKSFTAVVDSIISRSGSCVKVQAVKNSGESITAECVTHYPGFVRVGSVLLVSFDNRLVRGDSVKSKIRILKFKQKQK